jgi:AAA+ ATPase superfamily predicted ATPase
MNKAIINREEEAMLLQEMLDSSRAEFLTIYGRRRIGKTFLIREFFGQKSNIVFFKAVGLRQGKMSMQLESL